MSLASIFKKCLASWMPISKSSLIWAGISDRVLNIFPASKFSDACLLYKVKFASYFLVINDIAESKTLSSIHLEDNQIEEIDLFSIVKCEKLSRIVFDKNVKIRWSSEELNEDSLSRGLKAHIKGIREAHKHYSELKEEERKQKKREEAPEKITEFLNQFRPGIPVSLKRIAELAEITIDFAKNVVLEIIKAIPEVGEFLELEQVFIRKMEADIEMDKLLKQFDDWGIVEEGKKM